ncbi:ADPGLC-PPase large subunit [Hibiscus trionum]|uniref:glucose-1-phosphate adenylyltransferase n=1 Tax=Hibiscus trionum TaxID=183268 RepID=A0A9W7MU23_HIBTR|nr:ADPGLC-PPase large subunit [Hibiscus trionum]
MESLCMPLKPNVNLINASKGRGDGGSFSWGERRDFGRQLWKCLRAENGVRKAKPSVLCSAQTPHYDTDPTEEQAAMVETPQADPKQVASIILGGGASFLLLAREPSQQLIDVPMSNCINSGIKKIFILTQFNSFSLNRHLAKTYTFGNGVNFGDGFVEVLAATQTSGEAGKKWFQGTADAVRQFSWVFEDAKAKVVKHVLILSGDHLYRADYMDFVQKHIDTEADITVSCLPMDDSHASDFGLVKIDGTGRIIQFYEKPKGDELKAMQGDTSILGLSAEDAAKYPYIASMGVYVFKTDVLLKLLTQSYPSCNDFGSEIIPSAVKEHNVQAYLFNDYWEDIGTIKSFFDANLALTDQPPKFEFHDPKTPFYTSPRFLPPSKVDQCRIVNAIISHGCFLRGCTVQRSVVGIRSRLESGVDLQDTMMLGADFYQTASEIKSLLEVGKVPVGVGQNTKIKNCIIDKNAKIGKDVIISNSDGVEEAERPEEGFYIRSGITVIMKNATIKDGTRI